MRALRIEEEEEVKEAEAKEEEEEEKEGGGGMSCCKQAKRLRSNVSRGHTQARTAEHGGDLRQAIEHIGNARINSTAKGTAHMGST